MAKKIFTDRPEQLIDYHQIFAGSMQALSIHDAATGDLIECNQAAADLLGASVAELRKKTVQDISLGEPPFSTKEALAHIQQALREGHVTFEWLCRRSNGDVFWVDVTLQRVGNDGKLVLAAAHELSRLHQLSTNRERLFDLSVDLLCVAGFDGFFRELSPSWERALGWTQQEILSRPWLDLVHPDDQASTIAASQALQRGDTLRNFENRYRCNNGNYIWLSWNAFTDLHARLFLASARDVTELREAFSELQNSEERFRNLVQQAPFGIHVFRLNSAGKLIFVNTNGAADKMTGVPNVDKLGLEIEDAFPGLRGTNVPGDYLEVIKTGKALSLTRVPYDDGQIRGLFDVTAFRSAADTLAVSFVNITERIRLEEDLRQSQKMESLGRLAGGIAHDFNNMLSGIMGSADILSAKLENKPLLKRCADTILQASERASDLTKKLLSLSRRGKLVSVGLDVHEAINAVAQILEHSIDKSVRIDLNLAAEITTLLGDPSEIQSMLLNLGLNARDAMPQGGLITISTSNSKIKSSSRLTQAFALQPGDFIEITVADSGSGMDDTTKERIFEPFFTTKQLGRGTGLGLSSVYGTVKEHRGAITVDSEVGRGSRFRILLPVDPLIVLSTPEEPQAKQKGHGSILIIDDESLVSETAAEILRDSGYAVTTAGSSKSALEIYSNNKEKLDLVILDLVMPDLSGEQIFSELRKLNPKARVLFSSGYTHGSRIDDLLRRGAAGFISKPYRVQELLEVVQRCLI